jgi:cytochrome b pre-mRNA-processing protein 3
MILLPFRRPKQDPIITALYGTIVAQARSPIFYRGYGVPDTVGGRFDMIVLHLVLLLHRLKRDSGAVPPLGQEVFNQFCQDMDDNFREMGVGDLAVPKEMRKVGESFYGRAQTYEAVLAGDDAALEGALARNVFGKPSEGAARLAAYVRDVVTQLGRQNDFSSGQLRFPNPEGMMPRQIEESPQA